MTAYDENVTERLVKYRENLASKKQKLDTFVEAEIVCDEAVEDDDETMIAQLPTPTDPIDPNVFSNLEEEMDTRESRRKIINEEDEEEKARTMKYQIHEAEAQKWKRK